MNIRKFIGIVCLWLSCMICTVCGQNQTFYFERVALIVNNQRQTATGDGHYLTINKNGLYESDSQGISKNMGFLRFVNNNNGDHPMFEGSSSLGNNISYVFNSDYSRLNIHIGNGRVYVYQRCSDNGRTSYMRHYASSSNTYAPAHVSDNITPASSSRNSSRQTQQQKVKCNICHGTGYVLGHRPSVSEYGIKVEYYNCEICGKRVMRNSGHGHDRCTYCHGTGWRTFTK